MVKDEAVELFSKYGVLTKHELESQYEVALEQYIKSVNVESNLVIEMAKTMIFPAAIRFQSELATTCANLKAVGYEFDTDTLDEITGLVKKLQDSTNILKSFKCHDHGEEDMLAEARFVCSKILPAMLEVRKYADELESIVADDLWSLPTYQEMLFIK
jgi:glutamine synthetase